MKTKGLKIVVAVIFTMYLILSGLLLEENNKAEAVTSDLSSLPVGTKIMFGGRQYAVVDPSTGLVVSVNSIANKVFDPDNTPYFNPADSNNIGYWLNNTYYNSIPATERALITNTTQWSRGYETDVWSATTPAVPITANIGLLNEAEYLAVKGTSSPAEAGKIFPNQGEYGYWWTITPYSSNATNVRCVGLVGDMYNASANLSVGVRPAFRILQSTVFTQDPYSGMYYYGSAGANSIVSSLSVGDTIMFHGEAWRVVNPSTGLVVADRITESKALDTNNTNIYDPSDGNNLGYYLNNTYYNTFTAEEKILIKNSTWYIGDDTNETANSVTTYIGLLRASEYTSVKGTSSPAEAGKIFPSTGIYGSWSLITPRYNYPAYVLHVKIDGSVDNNYASNSNGVRPALRIFESTVVTMLQTGVYAIAPPDSTPPAASYNMATGNLTGVSTAIEYSINGGTVWNPCTGTTQAIAVGSLSASNDIKVRVAAIPGAIQTIDILEGSATPTAYTINYANETTTEIIPATVEYSTALEMTSPTAGTGAVKALTPGTNLYFREKGVGLTLPGAIQTLVVADRAVTPSYTINYTNETTTQVVAATDEYSSNVGMTSATSGTGVVLVVTPGSNRYFRTKATGSTFKSAVQTLTVPARPAITTAAYSTATEDLTSVTTEMEYSINGGTVWNTCSSTTVTIPLGSINATNDIKVRVAATGATFASTLQTLNILAAPAAPTAAYSTATENLTSVATTREYSIDGGTVWATCTGTTVAIPVESINATDDIKVRVAAAGLTLPGAIQTLNILAAPAATTAVYNTATGNLTSVATTREYSIDGGTVWIACTGTTVAIATGSLSATDDLKVRVKATGLTLPGLIQTIDLLDRPAAPTAAYSTSTGNLTGVTTLMEYSIDGGTVWNACSSTTVAIAPASINAIDGIQVRVKGVGLTLPGEVQIIGAVTVVITASTPDITYATDIIYTLQFSETVFGFDTSDIIVTNGTKGTFTAVDGATYTLNVSGSVLTVQTVTVNAGVCQNASGTNNISGSKAITIEEATSNQPILLTGMTPLIFDTSDFRNATAQEVANRAWYRYRDDLDQSVADRVANEKWANAKLQDGSMFVWIPRYTYKITENGATSKIEIKYSNGTTDDTVGGTYKVHPAFNFGGTQLTGIWVAKFESSNDGLGRVQVKPGVASWKSITINDIFNAARAMQTTNSAKYGISSDANEIDTHMMKNTEWGAVAYLTEAIRDKDEVGINSSSSYYTGGTNVLTTIYTNATNMEQSSTGNAYGVYDLNGGSAEYTASYIANGNTNLATYGNSLVTAAAKYKDELTLTPADTDQGQAANYTQTATQTDGMALHEISTAATGTNTFQSYSDSQAFPYTTNPFFTRGGYYNNTTSAGVFNTSYNTGNLNTTVSFRPVLLGIAPTLTIVASTKDNTYEKNITYTIEFSETVTGFDTSDIIVTNGTKGTFTAVDGDTYTLNVTTTEACIQTITVNAGACQYISGPNNISVSKTIIIEDAYNGPSNQPMLVTGMIPLIFDTTDFRNATAQEVVDGSWYSYRADLDQDVADRVANERWANAKLADGSMFVWIPRYTYKITENGANSKIQIKYSNGTADDTVEGTYKVHPSFNFGGEQLTGIWVAKFEASKDAFGKLEVKPGVAVWKSITINDMFNASRDMQTTNSAKYGISSDSNVVDTHMMKATEMGAITYLTEAIRDKDEIAVNTSTSYSGGHTNLTTIYTNSTYMEQSSTGNAYGVYDLSGGSFEFLAGYIANGNATLTTQGNSLVTAASKYKDELILNPANTDQGQEINYKQTEGQTDGMSIHEISTSWTGINTFQGYTDNISFPTGNYPFLVHDGDNDWSVDAGLFTIICASGGGDADTSFRPVLLGLAPTSTIVASTTDNTYDKNITYTIQFSETVTGFDESDIIVTNGTKGTFTAVDGDTYTLNVTTTEACIQTITVNAGACQYVSGPTNISVSKTITIEDAYNGPSNEPMLVAGMIPLIFDTTDFRSATAQEITDASWYSYRADTDQAAADRVANERWANVKLADGSMYVWIPRYTYKITENGSSSKIEIKYSNGTANDTVGGTYKVHTAFNFGGTELTGIWVSKFEASDDGSGKVQIKPGVASWKTISLNDIFNASRDMQITNSSKYGISSDTNAVDTHMMKNTELGAVVYLTEAIRDKDEVGTNTSSGFYTGGSNSLTTIYTNATNIEQSSTGNAYGVYDLNGGSFEYLAGYIANGSASLATYGNSLVTAASKYKDELILSPVDTDQGQAINYAQTEGKTDGMPIHEISTTYSGINTFQGYTDNMSFPQTSYPFFIRDGYYSWGVDAGIFTVGANNGSADTRTSFRTVLLALTESDIFAAPVAPVTTFSFDGVNANKLMGSDTTMEYSLDGGTVWTSCTDNVDLTSVISNITALNDIKVRVKENAPAPAGLIQTLDILDGPVATSYTINYVNETTTEVVPVTVEYSTVAGMTSPTTGAGAVIALTPGANKYFRVKATGLTLPGAVQTLVVGNRPATPAYTINYTNETTTQTVAATDEYANNVEMTSATSGTGVVLGVTPGNNLYFRVKATAGAFKSLTQTLVVAARPATPTAAYSTATGNLTSVTTAMEYSINGGGSYTACSSTTVAIAVGSLSATNDIKVRVAATAGAFASNIQTLDILAAPAAPTAAYSTATGNLTSVTTGMEYSIDGGTAWTTCTGTTVAIAVGTLSATNDIRVRVAATGLTLPGAIQTLDILAAPAATTYTINYTAETTTETIPATVEYSTVVGMTSPTTGTGANVALTPGANKYFRVKATGLTLPGAVQTLVVANRPATPAYTINYTNETTTQVVAATDEYANNIGMTSATSGTGVVLAVTPGNNLYFRTKATAGAFASAVQTLTVANRPATPTYTINYTNETTTQTVPATDEYSIDNFGTAGTSGTGAVIAVTPGTNLYFRTKATGAAFKSLTQTLVVAARPATPTAAYSTATGNLTSVTTAMEYSINGGSSYTACSSTTVAIAVGSLSATNDIKVRVAATGAAFASNVQTLDILASPAAPTAAYSTATGNLTSVTTAMEYSINGGSSYTACSGTTVAIAVSSLSATNDIKVRVAATGLTLPGAIQTLDILAAPAAPTYTINYTAETTTETIPVTVEYSTALAMTSPTTGTGANVALTPGANKYFRVKATGLTLPGAVQTLVVANRPATPAYTINYTNETTTQVVAATDEYANNIGMTSATSGTGVVLAVTPGNNLYFRTKATAGAFASAVQTLTVANRPATPTYTINYTAETTTQTVPATDEYSTDNFGTAGTSGSGAAIAVTPGTNLYFRTKATAGAFKSLTQTLVVAARPATPTAAYSTATGNLTSVTTAMEYSINGGSSYTACSSTTVAIAVGSLSATNDIKVRVAATAGAFASNIQTLDILAAPAAPTAAYSTATGNLTSVTTGMEYSINGGSSYTACSGTTVAIAVSSLSATNDIRVRVAATGLTLPGAIQTLDILVAPAATTYTINYTAETTTEVIPATVEYSTVVGMTSPTTGTGANVALTPGANKYFRVKATGLTLPGAVQTLVVANRPATPAYTINYTAETTTQVIPATDEYANNVGMTSATSGTGVVLAVTPGNNLYFRTKATAGAFASAVQTLTVANRPATPAAVYNTATGNLTSVTTAMEYSINGGTVWNACESTIQAIAVESLSASNDIKVVVTSTGSSFESNIQTIDILAGPSAPTFSNADAQQDKLIGLPINATNLEGRINSGSWISLIVSGTGESTTLVGINVGDTVDVRVKATGTTLYGETATKIAINMDIIAPTVSVTASTSDITSESSIIYTMQFSEAVTGFDIADITVSSGTKGTFTAVDADTYTLEVTNTGSSTQIVTVNAGVCTDIATNPNTSGSKTITIDRTQPTCVITANTTNITTASSIIYTFEFSKNVIDFVIGDITVTNGTKGTFTEVDQDTYTLVVTNSGSYIQTIHLDSGVCTDVLGNYSLSADKVITIDRAGPTVTITASTTDTTNASSITYTIQFNETVTGFDIDDITVINGTKGTFTQVDADTFTLVVTNSASCTQTVTVSAGVCQDALANDNTSGTKIITIERIGPSLVITANVLNTTNASSVTYTFEFSQNVTGFDTNDIIVTNGTKGTFAELDSNTYTLIVTNSGNTIQTVTVSAGVCVSQAAGDENTGATKVITIENNPPVITIDPTSRTTDTTNITPTISVSDSNGLNYWKYKWTDKATKPTEPIEEWTLGVGAGETITLTSNGVWYLHVQAQDTIGNIKYKYSGAYIKAAVGATKATDIQLPTITVNPENRVADTTNITAEVTVNDNIGIKSWKYKWTASTTKPTIGWITGVGTNQTISQTQNGTWYLHVEAEDVSGNKWYEYKGTYIKTAADTYGPQIRADITNREMSESSIAVVVSVTDSSGVANYKYKWTVNTVKPTIGWVVGAGTGQTITQSLDGLWYLHVEATDTKGNISYKYYGEYKKGTVQTIADEYEIGFTSADKVNFKYYLGIDQYGETRTMLVSKTGKSKNFVRGEILNADNTFKEGIYYIDRRGLIKRYSTN